MATEQRLAIIVTAQDLVSGKLGKVRSELAAMGTSGKIASVGIGGAMLAVNKGEQALGNLKNRLTSLAAPLAMIGLTGGLFTLGGALEQGITKADDMALAVEKFSGVTGLSAHTSSQLIAVMEKFGVDTAKVTTIAGFAEKTLGKLNDTAGKTTKSTALLSLETRKLQIAADGGKTTAINKAIAEQKATDALKAGAVATSKLTALDTQYGLHLVDSKGKVVDFATELNQVADMWVNKAIPADEKATVAAQLLGKGYMALVPMLALGSKGIADAAAEADKMGLTLKSAQDVTNVHAFIAAQRDAKDAISGLEVQLGLLVMPDLTKGLTAFTEYVSGHQDDIKHMFSEGLQTGEALVSFVTGTVVPAISSIAGAASGIWNSIPGPMKDLLVKGFVADRTMKFFFGMSPIHAVVSLAEGAVQKGLGSLVSGIFTKGSPANPMFVKDVTGGLGGGKPGGGLPGGAVTAAEDAGGAAVIGNGGAMLSGGAAVAIGGALSIGAVAAVAGVAIDQYSKISTQGSDLAAQAAKWAPTASMADLLNGQAAVLQGMKDLASQSGYNPLAAAGTGGLNDTLKVIKDAIAAYGKGAGAPLDTNRKGELIAQDIGTGHLSAQIGAALQHPLKANAVDLGHEITSAFQQSMYPNLRSMTSAMERLRQLQAKYLAQGDAASKAAAAALSSDIRYLAGRVDAVTEEIKLKEFIATGILGPGSLTDHTPRVPPLKPSPTKTPPGYNHAAGLLGMTRGRTDLGVAGEAGSEAIAILRNPRAMQMPGGSDIRALAAEIVAALQALRGGDPVVTVRDLTTKTKTSSAIGPVRTIGKT
jgi:hypothetical protein